MNNYAMLNRISRYVKKCHVLGPKKSIDLLYERMHQQATMWYWRYKAKNRTVGVSWHTIQEQHEINVEFASFFNRLHHTSCSLFKHIASDGSIDVVKKADAFCNNYFDILGSGFIQFEKIPWHIDFRLQQQQSSADVHFDTHRYYKDFTIHAGTNEEFVKDIKVPWELSRFQHLFVLGSAYHLTEHNQYAHTFIKHVTDWLDHNPPLIGPAWICPMDVGIRALNWVWAFHFFKSADSIPLSFWQQFVCSLYDHLVYLENNWEIYDSRTSNHYLSDLIGYYYLCWFFKDLSGFDKKLRWCHQELLKECEKQIFSEGTSYESSTYYHKLVTEIFYHFYLVSIECGLPLSESFMSTLKKMFSFIDWCTPHQGRLIQIGDNDSGMILNGINKPLIDVMKEPTTQQKSYFSEFGLSIIKTPAWHISLRHHAYRQRQPSGHFHNDVGSVTLAYKGIDLIVDPGSYIYTPSQVWRNRFRSVAAHSTFFIEDKEPVPLDERLFTLDLPESNMLQDNHDDIFMMRTYHDLYKNDGLRAQRIVTLDELNTTLKIVDQWQLQSKTSNLVSRWHFILLPLITPEKSNDGWLLMHQEQVVAVLTSTLDLILEDCFYSPSYGVKMPCKRLVACIPLETYREYCTIIRGM